MNRPPPQETLGYHLYHNSRSATKHRLLVRKKGRVVRKRWLHVEVDRTYIEGIGMECMFTLRIFYQELVPICICSDWHKRFLHAPPIERTRFWIERGGLSRENALGGLSCLALSCLALPCLVLSWGGSATLSALHKQDYNRRSISTAFIPIPIPPRQRQRQLQYFKA